MTVSYLLTLYNKQDYIGGVLDSVFAEQAATGGDITIYDDCSTDRSAEIADERLQRHPEIKTRLVRGEKNCGVSFATDRVIEAATQKYIRLIDADDVLVRGSTTQLLRLMQKHKLDFVYGRMGPREGSIGAQTYASCIVLDDPIAEVLRHLTATPSSSLFAAGALKKVSPLLEWVRHTQDFTMFLRLACHGAAMGKVDEITALWPPVFTEGNLSSASAKAYAEVCRTVAFEAGNMPLRNLRNASSRYAGRALKYFRNDAESRLSGKEKFDLWFWRRFASVATLDACVDRLNRIAELFERDRHVVRGLRKVS